MKKLLVFVLSISTLLCLTGCGKKENKIVVDYGNNIAEAFSNGDLATINNIVFGTNVLEMDDKLYDMLGESPGSETGALNKIFENVTVELSKTTDDTIEYEIEAPDMSDVFTNLTATLQEITEDELKNYIEQYAENADRIKTIVSLNYIIEDDTPIVNYREESFINAITGGLLEAYKTLYKEMMEEYIGGLN